MRMNGLDWTAMALVIVGGLNWGLIGFFNFNLVDSIFGEGSVLARVIYGLVGLSALYMVAAASKFAGTHREHHLAS